jgi:lysophospholipase L1-like esterase
MQAHGHTARRAVAAALAAVWALSLAACQGGSPDGRNPSPSASRPAESQPSATGTADNRTPDPGPSPAWDTDPDSLAAVGDSITRAFNACGLLDDCPQASWATGTDPAVDSLADRLLEHPARDSWNVAKSGAEMADMPGQMDRAAGHDPELVTMLAGANDACRGSADAMTPVAEFRAHFEEALGTLWRQSPDSQVYVAAIPDLKRLWQVGHEDPDARQVWDFGICHSMLRAPRATSEAATARRERVSDRVQEYNAVLRDVCSADRRCRWDGGAVHDYRITTASLSHWDWFHPSKEGQSDLAELAYERVTDR